VSALAIHPTGAAVAAQTHNGEIVVFGIKKGLKVSAKRAFVGHRPDAFPCRMAVSPDGKYIASGDAGGGLFIWDWESAKLRKTFELHEQVLIKAEWSPSNPSQIVTASWDNTLALLD
jgi:pre-mRNA-processing factor 17